MKGVQKRLSPAKPSKISARERRIQRVKAIRATVERLESQGVWLLRARPKEPFDLIGFSNGYSGDPFKNATPGLPNTNVQISIPPNAGRTKHHMQWRNRRGWLGIIIEPTESGFDREEHRAIAHDRGGKALFAVWDRSGVRFEA